MAKMGKMSNSKRRANLKNGAGARTCVASEKNARLALIRNNRTIVYKKSTNVVLVGVQLLMFLVLITYYVELTDAVDNSDWTPVSRDREARKMFGGYRITPKFCTPTRTSTREQVAGSRKGPAICMFNHECTKRNGEVVGACMDGFLFGACCQLFGQLPGVINDSVHSGVVSVIKPENYSTDYSDLRPEFSIQSIHNAINSNPNVYYVKNQQNYPSTENPITKEQVKNPSTLIYSPSSATTEKFQDITSSGVAQITNTLLNSNPVISDDIVTVMSNSSPPGLFSYSTISHDEADTILLSEDNVYRPSNVQISLSQNKPSYSTISSVTLNQIIRRPAFKPKPTKNPSQEEQFVLIPAVKKPHKNATIQSDISSIVTIVSMLNGSRPADSSVKTPKPQIVHSATTVSPILKVSSVKHPTSGHYITTPATNKYTSFQPPSTSYVYSPIITRRPGNVESTTKYSDQYGSTSSFYSKKPEYIKTPASPEVSAHDNYASTTLSYDEYWSNSNSYSSTTSDKKPPSTSYVYSSKPTKRPVSAVHNVVRPSVQDAGSLDTFSSVTPTVIVLSSLDESYTINPVKDSVSSQDNLVQIPLKPNKPIHQVTINNVITSNNMIHLGSSEKPPPTVLITPKPNTSPAIKVTTENIIEANDENKTPKPKPSKKPARRPTKPAAASTIPPYAQTTLKNEYFTSPDDLINFPPVRNPNLNATGSTNNYNNSVATVGVDDVILHEVEFTTPAFLQEDEDLNKKMGLFVQKIVGSLQGTFQDLHDIVVLDKAPNATLNNNRKPATPANDAEVKPTKKPSSPTKRPAATTKKPVRTSATTKRTTTTKKPARITTTKAPTTQAPTTIATTTKKPATVTTKKPRPTKPKTTTPAITTVTEASIGEDTFTTEVDDGSYKHLCGVRPMVKSSRIVGGKSTTFGKWPWQVLVRESTWLGLFTKNKCGGVLITNKFVTTAAHCQPGFLASLIAVFGEYDISGELESKRSVSKNVRRVIVHRSYDAATFENDLALLELESPVHYDSHIVPICMPSDDADFTGRMATVTGWGRLKYGGGVPSVLQEVQVPIMENNVCQEMFHAAGHSKVILNSFVCAGYANGQKDSCEGDSGGPLVLQRADGRWELAGTVSHGIKCAAPYLPGVYMRTTFYKPWLRSITGVN